MYIIVRVTDNVIVGSAANRVDEEHASKSGYRVYEIDSSEFSYELIGSKLAGFEQEEKNANV